MQVNSERYAEYCFRAASIVCIGLTFLFWGEWLKVLFTWLGLVPMAIVFAFFVGVVLRAMGGTLPDTEEATEPDHVWLEGTTTKVSDEIVGVYMDTQIHAWVLMNNPTEGGEDVKLFWESTVDLEAGFDPPPNRWFMILPPGLLYLEPAKEEAESLTTTTEE